MCGIAGIVGPERSSGDGLTAMRRMLGMLRHRGPDQFGMYDDGIATLGNARLSIIDLSSGQQPISNEDDSLWIVYNGELFNYVELRPDLEKRGHRFKTNSDTEVILHLYEEMGPDCLRALNGEFAFAIWNSREQRLFLARDRFGIRPLFYAEAGSTLQFASEIKALLVNSETSAEIDPAALGHVFTYWGPLPGRTIFRGIRQLPPGHYLERDAAGHCIKPYWEPSFLAAAEARAVPSPTEETEATERLRELLIDAAAIRLRSDVPVGAYLSGGLDSSLIAAIVSAKNTKQTSTFSLTFSDSDFDESEHQLRMARFLGTRHEIVHITHADIASVFPKVIWHAEVPVMRTAPAPMFLLSELVRKAGFKVVLTGEGADEVLAGYDIFKEAAIRRFWARHPDSAVRPRLLGRLYADIPRLGSAGTPFLNAFFRTGLADSDSPYYSHLVRWHNNARTHRFFSRDLMDRSGSENGPMRPDLPPQFTFWGPLERAQYLESSLFLSEYLLSSQGDRMAMANSVESRLPFLDFRVAEFCAHLPSRLKLRGLREKHLLREVARGFLPDSVWQRPKRPYRAPIHRSFFSGKPPDYVRELLSARRIEAAGLFDAAAVWKLVAKIQSGAPIGETDDMAIAGILSTQLVHEQFIAHFRLEAPVSHERDDIKVCLGRRSRAVPAW